MEPKRGIGAQRSGVHALLQETAGNRHIEYQKSVTACLVSVADGREIIYDVRKEGDVVGELCALVIARRERQLATSGGSGQCTLAQTARSSSASPIVSCWSWMTVATIAWTSCSFAIGAS